MRNSKLLIVLLVFIALLYGCDEEEKSQSQVDFKVLTSEEALPTNFYDIAFKRDTTPYYKYLVRKSVNKTELDETWRLYELEQEIPDVDFNESVVFFIGFTEGGCPSEIKDITFNSENNTLNVPLLGPDGNCTTIESGRTIVIKIEKELSEKIKTISIVESYTETTVPFE
jgi:hypothetical protein